MNFHPNGLFQVRKVIIYSSFSIEHPNRHLGRVKERFRVYFCKPVETQIIVDSSQA